MDNNFNITEPDKVITINHKGEKREYTKLELFQEVFEDSGNYKWGNGPWDFKMIFPNPYNQNSIHSIDFEVREAPCEGHEAVIRIKSGKWGNGYQPEIGQSDERILTGEFWPCQAFLLGKALLAFAEENDYSEEDYLKDMIKQKEEYGFNSVAQTGA